MALATDDDYWNLGPTNNMKEEEEENCDKDQVEALLLVEEEKKEQDDDFDWALGLDEQSSFENDASVTLVDSLPPQLHPAVSLGMKRVSSAYFSLQGSYCSEADLYSLSSAECYHQQYYHHHAGQGETCAATQVDANWLYHDIIMHVFTFLDARDLANFSETARRSNFECFYFLQLQLQRALLVENKAQMQSDGSSSVASSSEDSKYHHEGDGDRLASIAGSWSISRLASLDKDEADACVQEYLDSNTSLRTMPLSHSLAYIRQVLRRHGFPVMMMMGQPNQASSPTALAKAAMLVTLVGAATVMTGNVEVADSFGKEIPNMLFKVGFVGSLMSAARRKWDEKHPVAKEAESNSGPEGATTFHTYDGAISENETTSMRETAGHVARSVQELPAHLFQQVRTTTTTSEEHETNHDAPNSSTATSAVHDESPTQEASISRRMYDAFRLTASGGTHEVDEIAATSHSNLQSLHFQRQPLTPNPYEHCTESCESGQRHSEDKSVDGTYRTENSNTGGTNTTGEQGDSTGMIPRKITSGCVGAYFRTIQRATNSITRIVQEQRRARFEAHPEKEILTRTFIDACCSDEGLDMVKDLVQRQGIIDVEGFYCGSDGTETCALHAAAFHGATQVLEFLCGGIDERDPSKDQGLCRIDLQDQNGWTALHFAAGANSVEAARILADRGANLSVTAENGYTPYQWAQRLSNHEVADELKRRMEQSDPYYNANHPWISGASQPLSMIANRFFAMIPAR